MNGKTKKYDRKLNYSYTLGSYPTIDLLNSRPHEIKKVIINPKGESSEGISEIKKLCEKFDIRIEYGAKAIQRIAIKENTYVVGVFDKYESKVRAGVDHVVLVNPSDFGNLGTIIRTMVGFGLKDLVLVRPAADIFNPAVVRSAMGALFKINFEYFDSFEAYLKRFPKQKIYPFMLKGTSAAGEVKFEPPYSLVFGPENSGLEGKFLDFGQSIFIPHSTEIDSLNLSVAVSIGIFLATR